MLEIMSLLVVVGACTYVAMPLFRKQESLNNRESGSDARVSELLHQQQMSADTIEDLEFDFQTGKLSDEDFESLVADQKKIQTGADARLKDISGISTSELNEKLEKEIEQAKMKMAPDSVPTCPSCKKAIKQGDKFCSECGATLG